MIVKFAHTKTIQCYERILFVPVCAIPNSIICPVSALHVHFDSYPGNENSPAFVHKSGTKIVTFTHSTFVTGLKHIVKDCNMPDQRYSGHSLGRGGASFAYSVGVDLPMIQAQGDWASLSVLCYLSRPLEHRIKTAKMMADGIND